MVNIIFHDRSQDAYDDQSRNILRLYSLKELKAATQNFKSANVIRKEGLYNQDLIYKGVLPDKTPVQVKQPSIKDSIKEAVTVERYINEIVIGSVLRHQNVVRLLGACLDQEYPLLVYEHVDNCDLGSALHGDGNLKKRFDWKTRIGICLGIAKGLACIHHKDESKLLIVHRDIKPQNIFLDKNLNPKIYGFDLARLYTGDDADNFTFIQGTLGYLEPEHVIAGTMNDMTDVYSFGVLVLELLSGKKPFSSVEGSEPFNLVTYACELQESGDLIALIDDDLKTSFPLKEATRILNLAMSCIDSSRKLRPTMSEVVNILEGRTNPRTPKVDHQYFLESYNQFESGYFTLEVIKAATRNFNKANMTQHYEFGSFYQGVLPNGISITVKKLSPIVESGREKVEFQNEIDSIHSLRHPNIIRLLGYYSDEHNLLLVYEHMENNNLWSALFGPSVLKMSLNWKTRVKICLGIAKGLAFLHHKDNSKPVIIHRNIKSEHILLDKYLNPKISSFGAARLCEGEDMHYSATVTGTLGYVDPEYLLEGIINDKTNVYSFGVLLLVILSGREPIIFRKEVSEPVNLVSLAHELEKKGNLVTLIDEDLNMRYSVEEATTILNVAMLCTSMTSKLRPTMSEVVNILEGRTPMLTPAGFDPLSLTEVNSEVVITNIELNSTSNETELTDKGFSDLEYVSEEVCGEASVSSEISLKVTEDSGSIPNNVDSGSTQTVGLYGTAGSLTFRRIEVATKNFSLANKIGQGSTGSVYRGMLPNGKIVAVKQLLMKSDQGKKVFQNEVNTISSLKHPNLVSLLWHCARNDQHSLVYEYMENGSLYNALFENVKEKLTWPARVKICIGVAKGLSFLHDNNSKNKIVHRDIKLSNILLDKDLNPKISDFGLAIHYDREITHIRADLSGTIGYMAPEYVNQGTVTEKVDVYSFGILTLELITGKKKVQWISDHESVSLLDLVSDLQQKGDILGLIDQDLKTNIPVEEAEMMLNLAMLCTNPDPKLRPTMSEVVSILEGRTMIKKSTLCNLHDKTRIDSPMDNAAISVLDLTASSSTHHGNVYSSHMYHHNDGVPTVLSTNVGSDEKEYKNDAEFHRDLVYDESLLVNKVRLNNIPVDEATVESEPPLSKDRPLEMEYRYVEPSFTEEGKLQIMCTDGEFEAGCEEWKNSLIGLFVGENANFDVDIKMVKKLWEVKGDFSAFSMDNGYFIFQFSNIVDKIRVLQSADQWQIQQRPMILREWDWKLKFIRIEEMDSLPIWVKIYNLPLFLWTPSFLSKIGSGLGIPLFADQKTKNRERLAFAMLCVEVNCHKVLPEALNIMVKGLEYELKLEYESSQIAALFDRKTSKVD